MVHEKSNSKLLIALLVCLILLVSACSNAATAETETVALLSDTQLPSTSAATQTPSPSPVPPTLTPSPLATITPASSIVVEPHAMALDANAIAFDMQLLRRIGTGEPNDVLWSPNGDYLAVATSRGIYLHDGQTFEELRLIDIGQSVFHLAFSPDSRELAVAFERTAGVWNVVSGQQVRAMEGGFEDRIGKVVFGAGGHIAAIGDNCRGCGDPSGQAVIVWDGQSGEQLYFRDDIYMHSDAIDISPDGDTLLYFYGGIGFLDLVNRTTVYPLTDASIFPGFFAYELLIAPENELFFVSKSPWEGKPENYLVPLNGDPRIEILSGEDCWGAKKDGAYAVCHGEQNVIAFNLLDGQMLSNINVRENLKAVAIDPNGEHVAAITDDQVLIFDNGSEEIVKTFEYLTFRTAAAGAVLMKGSLEYLAATSSFDGVVSFWDLTIGELSHSIDISDTAITSLAFSPDQHTLAAIDNESVIRLIDIENSAVTRTYDLDDLSIGPLVFSHDGLQLASVDGPSSVIFTFDLQSQDLIFKGGRAYQNSYYLPYGPFFFNSEDQLMNWLWNETHISLISLDQDSVIQFPFVVESDYEIPEAAALSSDGRYAAFGLKRSSILIGDTSNFEIIHKLDGHGIRFGDGFIGAIRYLTFSPISNVLMSVGWDRTTRLWNVESGIELKTLDVCCYADFTDDGRFLVAAGNSVIEIWGVPPLP